MAASVCASVVETLRELADTGEPTEVVCEFCRKAYSFLPEELLRLREEADG